MGNLGSNLYSYCLNNPIIKVDTDGNKPGDLFDTMDEAAIDFANYINGKSIKENRESASYIYTKKVVEERRVTYINLTSMKGGVFSSFLNFIFGGKFTKTVTKRVIVTKYTYRTPKKGTADGSTTPVNWFGHNMVAILHTHAAYNVDYSNDDFSPLDINNANRHSLLSYVATLLGTLRKYNPFFDTDTVIKNDITFDGNHPMRR